MSQPFSIANFAESVILEDIKNKVPFRHPELPKPPAGGKDISNIEVTNEEVDNILSKSLGVKPEVKKPVAPKIEVKPPSREPEQLLKEFTEVLIKGKQLIQEMTTCGMLGVNLGGPGKSGKKKKKSKTSHLRSRLGIK